LTLARSLAEIHGGSLTATSDGPGQGSEFVIRLPATVAPEGASAGTFETHAGSATHSRVLVVDDNVDTARSIARLLNLLGHSVEIAHDGPAAIETARAFRPDVLLLDIGLPTMDGYEVARRLRAEDCGKHARIIAITGYGQDEDRRRSGEAGFDHHLIKPVDFRSLVTLLADPVV
jgi:CheY-like chemotaxis protein